MIHFIGFKIRLVSKEVKHLGVASNEVSQNSIREIEFGGAACLDLCPSSSGQNIKGPTGNFF